LTLYKIYVKNQLRLSDSATTFPHPGGNAEVDVEENDATEAVCCGSECAVRGQAYTLAGTSVVRQPKPERI